MSFITLSKQADVVGSDRYRDEETGTPLAYRELISHTVAANPAGTSNNVTVKVTAPSLVTINGIITSTDSFLATAKFTSLQKITDDTTRAKCYDDLIRFLIATRTPNLNGQLPQSTNLPANWQDFDVAAASAAMA